ncbi:Permeases of the major facilitator superfamily [Alloactinosynnema sp. L-07]|uniref:MFS transporter n=1 Tax=Alloactinosynnema sp. L-07 TaxID=1653480 RepID=UPI00065F0632|nr:MFS transporter [Alloactinosynnema sp. L-07]CRK56679.1 Permeases of the major facilitator superfamily [Alloactinosynnema sp. L-07]
MYLSTTRAAARAPGDRVRRRPVGGVPVSGTVIGLGLVSMFTDMSAEMVTAILPMYLIYGVGVGYLELGAIDGLYTGATAVLRLAGGYAADRLGRPKAVAAVGYGLSAVTKLGFPLVGGSVPGIGAVLACDRAGKGIRTAPRDAMITLATPRAGLGRAFGLHRALDTAGALLGPLIAFALIAGVAVGYDAVFTVSFGLAVIGLIVLLFFVTAPPATPTKGAQVGLRAGLALFRGRGLRRIGLAAGLLGVCTVGDMFLYLALQQRTDLPPAVLPLLPLGTALVFMAAAVPVGRLADRLGRWRVFLTGHVVLVAVYLLVATAPSLPVAALVLVCHGLFYAATDGVLMALAAPHIPEHLRGTGLAVVQTVQALARATGAVLFGVLAAGIALGPAFAVATAALACTLMIAARIGRREEQP